MLLRTWPALLVIAVIAIVSGARAASLGTTVQIGGSVGGTQTAAAVSGSGVTWSNLINNQFNIFYQDLATTNPPLNLSNSAPGENAFLEDIDGNYLVWTHTGPTAAGDLILYDLKNALATPIAASDTTTLHFQHPSIGGRYVVFERITTQYDIDVFDITIGGSPGPQVTNDPALQLHPRVSGDVIVYEDYNANPNIPSTMGYHIASHGPPFLIAAFPAATPDVDGNNVVYVNTDGAGNNQIVRYDLSTGVANALTSAASHKLMPRISGARVVWSDDRNNQGMDVYAYNLTTNTEELVAGGAGDQFLADVDGDRIVFTDNSTGAERVFLYTFPPPPPPPPNLPLGCDPAQTNLVEGPVTLDKSTKHRVHAWRTFHAPPGHTYYLCVENGLPDGSLRTDDILAAVDGRIVLREKQFRPENDPQHFVAKKLRLHHDDDDDEDGDCDDGDEHYWAAVVHGDDLARVNVSVRVAK